MLYTGSAIRQQVAHFTGLRRGQIQSFYTPIGYTRDCNRWFEEGKLKKRLTNPVHPTARKEKREKGGHGGVDALIGIGRLIA
jgi:hypothetical protein